MQEFSPIYSGLYERSFFFTSCRRGAGDHTNTPPAYFEKLMQYSPSEAIGILSKTVGCFALKGVVFKGTRDNFKIHVNFMKTTFSRSVRQDEAYDKK